jgi:hypothetical protein
MPVCDAKKGKRLLLLIIPGGVVLLALYLFAFVFADHLENRWYSILITLDPKHHLKVWLNNLLVADMTDDIWAYKVSDIAVRVRFSKTRPFDGGIADGSMQFALQPKRHLVSLLLSGVRTILAVFFLWS